MSELKERILIVCAAVILTILVAGCGQKRIVVPTPVACVDRADIPAEPDSVKPLLTGNAVQDAATLAIGLLQWKGHAGELRALLKGCEG